MEQNQNIDESSGHAPSQDSAGSDLALIPEFPASAGEAQPQRRDGWSPARIRAFLETLAEGGSVMDAARAAGMSRQSAYAFRNRADGRAFDLCWRAAELKAARRLEAELMERALNGYVETTVQDGVVVKEQRRHDNRLALVMLDRIDRKTDRLTGDRPILYAASEFENFLDIVCAGGEQAADFIAARTNLDYSVPASEHELLERAENYRRYGVGLTSEIDVSDLDLERIDDWTDEQIERGLRTGVIRRLDDDAAGGFDPSSW